jgi:hypothetical protein
LYTLTNPGGSSDFATGDFVEKSRDVGAALKRIVELEAYFGGEAQLQPPANFTANDADMIVESIHGALLLVGLTVNRNEYFGSPAVSRTLDVGYGDQPANALVFEIALDDGRDFSLYRLCDSQVSWNGHVYSSLLKAGGVGSTLAFVNDEGID